VGRKGDTEIRGGLGYRYRGELKKKLNKGKKKGKNTGSFRGCPQRKEGLGAEKRE